MTKTLLKCGAGFAVGWLIYMFVFPEFDEHEPLINRTFEGVILSGVFVFASLVVGLPLRFPKIKKVWALVGFWPLLLTVVSIFVIIFHEELGLQTDTLLRRHTYEEVKIMSRSAARICYFIAIFPIVNLPQLNQPIQSPQPTAVNRRG